MKVSKQNIIFGPVPSRRFGRSLGIDLIPHKTCSFDCIYCECGKTTNITVTRFKTFEPKEVISALEHFVASHEIDAITLAGSGEPTLYEPVGELIDLIKTSFPSYPLVILTNGSLLSIPEVRSGLSRADIVAPSLDAPNERLFKKINRPHPSIKWEEMIDGLIRFRREYKGFYRLEILFLKEINDHIESIKKISEIAKAIEPDLVDLNTLCRPGTLRHLEGLSKEELEEIATFFESPCKVIGSYAKKGLKKEEGLNLQEVEDAIVEILKRRPSVVEEISDSLGISQSLAEKAIERLDNKGLIKKKVIKDRCFYFVKSSG